MSTEFGKVTAPLIVQKSSDFAQIYLCWLCLLLRSLQRIKNKTINYMLLCMLFYDERIYSSIITQHSAAQQKQHFKNEI